MSLFLPFILIIAFAWAIVGILLARWLKQAGHARPWKGKEWEERELYGGGVGYGMEGRRVLGGGIGQKVHARENLHSINLWLNNHPQDPSYTHDQERNSKMPQNTVDSHSISDSPPDSTSSASETSNTEPSDSLVTMAQQDQKPSVPLPLNSIVKLLTQFLFNEIPFPHFLQQYGHLMLAFTGGAAIGSSLYHFFKRHKQNRAKIQLAVFHVVRMVENAPDLQAQLQNPHKFIAKMEREVERMTNSHRLTKNEAKSTMLQLKRKVWSVADGQVAAEKRRKIGKAMGRESDMSVSEQFVRALEDGAFVSNNGEFPKIVVSSPTAEDDLQTQLQEQEEETETDVSMLHVDHHTRTRKTPSPQNRKYGTLSAQVNLPRPSQARSLHERSSQQPPSSTQKYRAFEHIPSSDSDDAPISPTPAPRPGHTTSESAAAAYGIPYEKRPSPLPASNITSSPTKAPPPHLGQSPTIMSLKHSSMIEAATRRAFDPKAPGNELYESPFLRRSKGKETSASIKTSTSTKKSVQTKVETKVETKISQQEQIQRANPARVRKFEYDDEGRIVFIRASTASSDLRSILRSSAPSPDTPVAPSFHNATIVQASSPTPPLSSPLNHDGVKKVVVSSASARPVSSSSPPVVPSQPSSKKSRGRPRKNVSEQQQAQTPPRKVQTTPATRRSARQTASRDM
ncbi:hypothetical protein N0V83_005348 [Neocucurbitaria cava]|uniref:Uncharacterized protein n=1 Tax=Neocucurbitaria cava TaxID=798079 RepID=A0A9W8Y8Q1_9PLEO|nr:hypothetical protein N0V83_005348 [Neocucurbitaria cava]